MEKNITNIIKYSPTQTKGLILDKLNPKTKFVLKYKNVESLTEDALTILDASKLNLIKIREIENLPSDFKVIDKIIRSGFLPKNIYSALDDYYLRGFSEDEIRMWRGYDDIEHISKYLQKGEWIFANIEGWKKFSIDNAVSFPLVLYADYLLYRSMRPKTEMLIFKNPTSKTYTSKKLKDKYSFILDGTTKAIPVTRYSKGMSRGLFFKNATDEKFCGTFYYFEPESDVLLGYKTSVVYRNKYEAVKDMGILDVETLIEDSDAVIRSYYKNPENFPEDLKMTFKEYVEIIKGDSYDDEIYMMHTQFLLDHGLHSDDYHIKDEEYWGKLGEDTKKYIANEMGLYAFEDDLDQPLCDAARSKGIDVVILTDMIGSMQIVTEVLDTRDEKSRFSNLYYLHK